MKSAVDVHLSCGGLGDAVSGLYAACGLANAGYQVKYHHRYLPWLARCSHPGVTAFPQAKGPNTAAPGLDMNWDYPAQLAVGLDRKQWYCDAVARELEIPKFRPVRPREVDSSVTRKIRTKYVLLSPFSAHYMRCWPLINWLRLAELLSTSGFSVWLTCTADQRADLTRVFGPAKNFPRWLRLYHRLSPEEMVDLVIQARCVVGNDSGIAHVAGLFGVPTVAVHSHLSPGLLWSHTEVVGVVPETRCSPCSWQYSRGFTNSCELHCTALGSISPERVLDEIGDLLNAK